MYLERELKEWAIRTHKEYARIASEDPENRPPFYNQSDLTKLERRPDLFVSGINPGSGGNYASQRMNENWLHINETESGNHLLLGNYCKDLKKPNGKTGWEGRTKWNYWNGLKSCLAYTQDSKVMDSEEGFILTNASFFATPSANGISDDLLNRTLPYTLELIEISNPKHIIFLSGKKCFERLTKIQKDFVWKHVIGNICVGLLNKRTVLGIPHPAYKTTEEIALVRKALHHIYDMSYDDIHQEDIEQFCADELQAYKYRIVNRKSPNKSADDRNETRAKIDIKKVEQLILARFENKIYDNGNRLKWDADSRYGITIAKGSICVRQAYEGKAKTASAFDTEAMVIEMLKNRKYQQKYVWLGLRSLRDFGGVTEEEICDLVTSEVEELFRILDELSSDLS